MSETTIAEMAPFNEQDERLLCVGFTFTEAAYNEVKKKMSAKSEVIQGNDDGLFMYGMPCYVVNGQDEECIGWHNKKAMTLHIQTNGRSTKLSKKVKSDKD